MASGFVAVGVASSQLAPADPSRGKMLVQNCSANDVWIDFGRPAVAGQCLHLPANQAAPTFLDTSLFFTDLTSAIFGIASAAGSKVYYVLQSNP